MCKSLSSEPPVCPTGSVVITRHVGQRWKMSWPDIMVISSLMSWHLNTESLSCISWTGSTSKTAHQVWVCRAPLREQCCRLYLEMQSAVNCRCWPGAEALQHGCQRPHNEPTAPSAIWPPTVLRNPVTLLFHLVHMQSGPKEENSASNRIEKCYPFEGWRAGLLIFGNMNSFLSQTSKLAGYGDYEPC